MIKRKLWIVLMCVVVLAFTGCGGKNKIDKEVSGDVSENEYVTENESVLENETVTEKEETQKIETDNKKNDTTTNTETNKNNTTTNKNESTSNKNETTTKPSAGNTDSNKKPSTESTTKPSTGSTGNSGSTNNSGSTGNTQNNNSGTTTKPSTPVHEHKWVEVTEDKIHYYDWINTCFKCGANLTKMTADDMTYHVAIICGSRYGVKLVEVDYVTENIQKEPVVTGYKCECGATKKK